MPHGTPCASAFAPLAAETTRKAAPKLTSLSRTHTHHHQGLGDSTGKIRTAVGMAIATIAQWDWPEQWPELTGTLVGTIRDRRTPELVSGALRCLQLIAADMDDTHLPAVVPTLLPDLLRIAGDPAAYSPSLQRRAMALAHTVIATLAVMSGAHKQATRALLAPMLPAWLDLCAGILAQPLKPLDAVDCAVKLEALKTLLQVRDVARGVFLRCLHNDL